VLQITRKTRRLIGRWLRAITMFTFFAAMITEYLPARQNSRSFLLVSERPDWEARLKSKRPTSGHQDDCS